MTASPLPLRVILVEDNETLAESLVFAMNQIGIGAEHAGTGESAVELIDRQKPDLVLLDLNLPGMGGWDVLEHIKNEYGEHGVPIIVTTAFGDNTNRIVGRLHYVKKYLVKPFTFQELFKAIEEVLEIYKISV
jgi:DNA-binding response OmpR family regulator